MTTVWILQILVALTAFANKVFLLIGLRLGWLLGSLSAVLAILYFHLIGLQIYTALEVGLFVLTGYGFFKKELEGPRVERAIRLVIMVVMSALAIFAYSGSITVVELPSAVAVLWGTYYLSHEKEGWGWALNLVAHALAAVLGYQKEQAFFADFQVASVFVCIAGMAKEMGVKKREGG